MKGPENMAASHSLDGVMLIVQKIGFFLKQKICLFFKAIMLGVACLKALLPDPPNTYLSYNGHS